MVKEDGLYVGYGLTQIDALEGQSVILDNSQAQSNVLGTILSGSGGFIIDGADDVRIGNAASDYTGATLGGYGSVINAGTLAVGKALTGNGHDDFSNRHVK